jgi:hypothetical protein
VIASDLRFFLNPLLTNLHTTGRKTRSIFRHGVSHRYPIHDDTRPSGAALVPRPDRHTDKVKRNTRNKMKSKRNLTRFTYETAAFEGWRLCISKTGTTFTKYFSDKKFGSGKKSLAAAEKTLNELKEILAGSKLVAGKLTPTTIKKANKLLADS